MVAIHKPAHDVILKPVVSEKSYAASDRGQYTFVVAPDANKVQIKQAIEEIFNVKVTNVNTDRKSTRLNSSHVKRSPCCRGDVRRNPLLRLRYRR